MDEIKEKASFYESMLYGWFVFLILLSLVFCFFDLDKLACLSLYGGLLALIIQKFVRIFDICFLMPKEYYFIRLVLLAVNLFILYLAVFVLKDLYVKFGNTVMADFSIKYVLAEFINYAYKILEYLEKVLFFLR
ncbi:MAG: hypothetical protein IKW58_00875 [Alphaproteobacteria bacterium]|nr:hypothetical protein [Alphaproteobacteria bacterium]